MTFDYSTGFLVPETPPISVSVEPGKSNIIAQDKQNVTRQDPTLGKYNPDPDPVLIFGNDLSFVNSIDSERSNSTHQKQRDRPNPKTKTGTNTNIRTGNDRGAATNAPTNLAVEAGSLPQPLKKVFRQDPLSRRANNGNRQNRRPKKPNSDRNLAHSNSQNAESVVSRRKNTTDSAFKGEDCSCDNNTSKLGGSIKSPECSESRRTVKKITPQANPRVNANTNAKTKARAKASQEENLDKIRSDDLKLLFQKQKVAGKNKPMGACFSSKISANVASFNKQDFNVDHHEHILSRNENDAHKFVKPSRDSKNMMNMLISQLNRQTYECVICYEKVKKNDEIWFCDVCYVITHFKCLEKWINSSILSEKQEKNGDVKWRCPGCQHKRMVIPTGGTCFCGTHEYPIKYKDRGNAPHTCKKPCRNVLNGCNHTCIFSCHPGKCPPCKKSETVTNCFCGKRLSVKSCDQAHSPSSLNGCGEKCGKTLGCSEHTCQRYCHPGQCLPCEIKEERPCYCGKSKLADSVHKFDIKEGWVVDSHGSDNPAKLPANFGGFSCGESCGIPYSCKQHFCMKICHPHKLYSRNDKPQLDTCPWNPNYITSCPCMKTSLSKMNVTRSSCSDPIPTCGQVCNKILRCGHLCKQMCHHGECLPCNEKVLAPCRCGREKFEISCSDVKPGISDQLCNTPCKQLRSCKKHLCGIFCCPGNHAQILANKKSFKSKTQIQKKGKKIVPVLDSALIDELVEKSEELHFCSMKCNKLLKCGKHNCDKLCHVGPCDPCSVVELEPLLCGCGMTAVEPPVKCGSQIPKCPYSCNRVRSCGHFEYVSHECHPQDTDCPPCTVLMPKPCQCEKHKIVPNVPCSRVNVYCDSFCGKLLDCGSHYCQRTCHSTEENCLSMTSGICKNPCGKTRKCGHICAQVCHSPSKCKENIPCTEKVVVSCECGYQSKTVSCYERSKASVLECNELCKLVIRNKNLASALKLYNKIEAPLSGFVNIYYRPELIEFAKKNKQFVAEVEQLASLFISDQKRWNHWFAPMRSEYRYFLHMLAPYYNCSSVSVDQEPKRNVCWTKKKLTIDLPILPVSKVVFDTDACKGICVSSTDSALKEHAGSTGSKHGGPIFETDKPYKIHLANSAGTGNSHNSIYNNSISHGNFASSKSPSIAPEFVPVPVSLDVYNALKSLEEPEYI